MSLGPIPGEREYDGGSDDEPTIQEPELAADDPMRAFLPRSFGKQAVKRDVQASLEQTRRAPPPPPVKADSGEDSDQDSDSEDSEEEFPISHELVIPAHTRPISSISLDPAGTRFVTASHDTTIRFYDWHAMSSAHLHSFKTLSDTSANSSSQIHSATFSPLDNGQHVLVVSATPQAKILTRDGDTVAEFVKGDPYLRDMHNTKGHVSEVTGGVWSASDKGVLVTGGTDSTLRIWDVASARRGQRDVLVHRSAGRGGRSRICAVQWSNTGGMIGATALDGVLSIWASNGPYTRPVMQVRDAHTAESWTGGLAFSSDARLLVTAGADDCVKLWDTRKLKAPVSTRTSFPTSTPTGILFSPSGTNVLVGDRLGNLHVLSAATLASEHTLPSTPGSPLTALTWHPRINHIMTGSANGTLHVLYSPKISHKGATTLLSRAPRKRHIDDDPNLTTDVTAVSGDAVVLPNTLLGRKSLGGIGGTGDRRRPNVPAQTPWGKSQPDQGHIDRSIALSSMRDEDPREALLKYADVAEREPMFTMAWRETQPKTIYADLDEEGGDEEEAGGPSKRVKR